MNRLLRALLALAALLLPSVGRADPQFTLLVIAAPSKYHYEYIPVARESLEKLGRLHAFAVDWHKDGAPLDGDLARYAAILLLNTPADEFSSTQRVGLEHYCRPAAMRWWCTARRSYRRGCGPGTRSW